MINKLTQYVVSALLSLIMFGCATSEGYSINSTSFKVTDTIKIELPKKHPKNLAVFSPSGQFYILHSQDDGVNIMQYQAFEEAKLIEINISKAKGLTWVDGKESNQHVFKEVGEYMIYMADNLEQAFDQIRQAVCQVTK